MGAIESIEKSATWRPRRMRPFAGKRLVIPLFEARMVLVAGMLLTLGASTAYAGHYVEEFDTATYKDAAHTNVDWNTAAGKLQLFPLQPSVLGTYDSPGVASKVTISGTVAYIADAGSGLRIVNIANPASPASLGTLDTSGSANDVAVSGTVAYVADGVSGLQIINVSNPASPSLLGTFNTSGDAKGVAISGTVAYVADGAAGLQIINVSNPASPALLGTYNTLGDAKGVAISGRAAYVADDASGLQIINVTNSASPTLLGTYDTPGVASGVVVSGTRAYVADDLSGLQIIDVTNPASPALLGTYDTPGDAFGVAVSGTVAYVADAAAGLQIVNVTNPAGPTLLGAYDTSGSASGVTGVGARAYVADGSSGLQIIQVGLHPPEPTVIGTYATTGIVDIKVFGTMAYIAKWDAGIEIVDVSNPANPVHVASYDTPGFAFTVAVSGTVACVADFTSLLILDVSNPASPTLLGTYDRVVEVSDVAVSGTTAYLVDNVGGLKILDVSDPVHPSLFGSFFTDCGSGVEYDAIAISGTVAYVAAGGCHLVTIDVSNPRSPALLGTFDGTFAVDGFTFDIAVSGSVAYILQHDTRGVLMLNVANPANPTELGHYYVRGAGSHITASGNLVYLAYGALGLDVIDFSDPANPTVLWTTPAIPGRSVQLLGTMALVATDTGISTLNVDDPVSSILTGTTPGTPGLSANGVAVSGTTAYVVDLVSGLQTIDVTDPTNPVPVGNYDTPGNAYAVAVSGTLAYVADGVSGLQAINVSNPANPALLGTLDTSGESRGIAVSGTVAYVADGASGLQIVNVSNPANPALLGTYNTTGFATGVAVSGTVAYVADGASGLQIINVSNPATPTFIGAYNTPGLANAVAVSGTVAYVADGNIVSGLQIINVSNPASPTFIGVYGSFGNPSGVAVSGTVAYLTDGGLQIIDVANPASPSLLRSFPGYNSNVAVSLSGALAYLVDVRLGLQILQTMEQRFDAARHLGQSLAIDGDLGAIRRARLTSTQVGDVAWKLSGDRGVTWMPATPGGYWVTFDDGSDLRWQATVLPAPPSLTASPPEASRLEVEWLHSSPVIELVADVAGDQGGKVRLQFDRSGYDIEDETRPAIGYSMYRRVDDSGLARRVHTEGGTPQRAEEVSGRIGSVAASSLPTSSLRMLGDRTFVLGDQQSRESFPPGTWEVVGYVGATQSDTYTALLPTTGDSTASGIDWSVYMITVHTNDPEIWFASRPDSGYSVDNLAPNVPANFTAIPQGGMGNQLDWDDSVDADFRYFNVYRSTDPNFTHGPENLVYGTTESSWTDSNPGGGAVYYQLTALDFSGNESDPATASTGADVEGTKIPARFALHAVAPNPIRSTAMLRYDVPASGGEVQLGIYDIGGRIVRTLVDGQETPGERSAAWDGRDENGHKVPAGMYLCRMRTPDFSQTRKLLLAR